MLGGVKSVARIAHEENIVIEKFSELQIDQEEQNHVEETELQQIRGGCSISNP